MKIRLKEQDGARAKMFAGSAVRFPGAMWNVIHCNYFLHAAIGYTAARHLFSVKCETFLAHWWYIERISGSRLQGRHPHRSKSHKTSTRTDNHWTSERQNLGAKVSL